ncbi:hypothetical protein [Kingella potus]|uniref:hypothetical protein n=1 Tax=Kingella potus TaxID=265175 RepID=UPI001FD05D8F|nr:hypothetical protein [Kingella potus]UOP01488.1 hypothetical protein LVJ84_04670 [Kingella potus]
MEGGGVKDKSDYVFTLFRQPEQKADLPLGENLAMQMMPGALATYSFVLERASHIGIDWLKTADSTVRWRILNQDNTAILQGYLGREELSAAYLPRGHYRLEVESTQRYTGEVRFRVLDAQTAATPLWQDNRLELRLAGGQARVYRLDTASVDRLAVFAAEGENEGSLQWMLTNAYGQQIGGGVVRDGADTVILNRDGTYYLWLNPQDLEQMETTVRLAMWQEKQPTSAVWAGDRVLTLSGRVDYAGETLAFDLDVAQSGMAYLVPENLAEHAEWTLKDEDGRALFAETAAAKLLYLQQGRYRLDIRYAAGKIGEATAILYPAQQLPLLLENTDTVLPSAAAGETVFYRLPTGKNKEIRLRISSGWRAEVRGAFGQNVFYRAQQEANGSVLLIWDQTVQGDVYIRLAAEQDQAAGMLRWNGTADDSVSPVAEEIVANSFIYRDFGESAGDQRFRFTLKEEGLAFIRFYEGNLGHWTLDGPRGREYSGYGRQTLIPALTQGSYTLTLHQVQGVQAFAVGISDGLASVAAGGTENGELAAGEFVRFYRLETAQGQDMWFRATNSVPEGLRYTVYDRTGNVLADGGGTDNPDLQRVPHKAGSYTVVVWRQNAQTRDEAAPVRFEWLATPKSDSMSLIAGIRQSGRLAGYGHYYDYAFTLDEAAVLQVEPEDVGDLSFALYDGRGNAYDSRAEQAGRYHYVLGRGEYRLRVQNTRWPNTGAVRHFAFSTKLVTSGSADVLPTDTVDEADLSDSGGSRILNVDLNAGTNYWIGSDRGLADYQRILAHIFDADGNLVSERFFYGEYWYGEGKKRHGFVFSPVQTGRYTVVFTSVQSGKDGGSRLDAVFKTGEQRKTEYSMGARVEGRLNRLQDSAAYDFTLSERQKLWIDITGRDYAAKIVRQADGQTVYEQASAGSGESGAGFAAMLEAGAYTLILIPDTFSPQTYSFRLSDAAALPLLLEGEKNTQTAAQSEHPLVWRFDGKAGETVLAEVRGGTVSRYWSVQDANGKEIVSGYAYRNRTDVKKITLPLDGGYILQNYGGTPGRGEDTVAALIRRTRNTETTIRRMTVSAAKLRPAETPTATVSYWISRKPWSLPDTGGRQRPSCITLMESCCKP